jgi:hypothetical protein
MPLEKWVGRFLIDEGERLVKTAEEMRMQYISHQARNMLRIRTGHARPEAEKPVENETSITGRWDLRVHANLEEVWHCHDRTPREHEWARHVRTAPDAPVPLAGFGASDCGCESHLYFFGSRPSKDGFVQTLRASGRRHPPMRLLRLK